MNSRFDGAAWFKSTHSGTSGNCVMVAFAKETQGLPAAVGVHDSKNPAQGHFEISPGAWDAFKAAVTK